MSYELINKQDPRIDAIFESLEKMEQMIDGLQTAPRPAFHGDYFLTDEELSKVLKVSRRTLQEYRTLGVIPYYLVQGKALYKESDIQKVLDDAYKKDAGKNSDGYDKTKETVSNHFETVFFVSAHVEY